MRRHNLFPMRPQQRAECADRAGCIFLRTHREPPSRLIGVYKAREAGIDGDGYAVVCEAHGTLVCVGSRSDAESTAQEGTKLWCDDCRTAKESAR